MDGKVDVALCPLFRPRFASRNKSKPERNPSRSNVRPKLAFAKENSGGREEVRQLGFADVGAVHVLESVIAPTDHRS